MTVQGAIESVGVREVLRLALAQAPTRLTLASCAGQVTLWCADDGVAAEAPRATAAEAVAQALALTTGTFTIEAVAPEQIGGHVVPLFDALGPAEVLAASWPAVVAVVHDPAVPARLVRRLGGPTIVTADQWRVVARVGAGRTVADLAALLDIGERASQRVVAGLVADGLLELVTVPAPLAPPVGPALAPPEASVDEAAARVDDVAACRWADDADGGAEAENAGPQPLGDPVTFAEHDAAEELDRTWAPDGAAAEPSPHWAQDEPADGAASWPDAAPAPTQAWDAGARRPAEVVSSWDDPSWGDAPAEPTTAVPTTAVPPTAVRTTAVPATPEPAASKPATAAPKAPKPATPKAATGRPSAVEPLAMAPGTLAHRPLEPVPALEPEPATTEPNQLSDELLGTLAGDDELVNRALLFKFLSSVRE